MWDRAVFQSMLKEDGLFRDMSIGAGEIKDSNI